MLGKWLKPKPGKQQDGQASQAYLQQGNACLAQEDLSGAEASYRQAIALDETQAAALVNLGHVLREQARHAEAKNCLQRALEIDAENADAYFMLGLIAESEAAAAVAIDNFKAAIALKPDFFYAYQRLCRVCEQARRLAEAEAVLQQGLQRYPMSPELNTFLGNVLLLQDRLPQAVECYSQIIEAQPENASAYNNRGLAWQYLNEIDSSLPDLEEAIRLAPDYADAHWNKALSLLLQGELQAAWPEYEWRWQREENRQQQRHYAQVQWRGDKQLQGKNLLLYPEQGFGDAIQFSRYTSTVAALGARVILEAHPSLHRLLRQLPGVSELVTAKEAPPEFDYHCPLMSLPLAFNLGLSDISGKAYLRAEPEKIEQWRRYLGEKVRPRVGLVWSGNPKHNNDRKRSIALDTFRQALTEEADYICLQEYIREQDRSVLAGKQEIRCYTQELSDFSDTAALVELMDLVISVDTSVAHLAGALGKEVWILLPYAPDWRWLLDRDDSPWYDSARLFRQQEIGEWQPVLKAVKQQLAVRFAA